MVDNHRLNNYSNLGKPQLSKNEILYFRNQGLDPSLEGSFEATFEPTNFSGVLAYLNQEFKKTKDNKFGNKGEYASRIKAELEEKLDDKLVTLGDWMVQEFYPAQYEHYNKTYQKVYRADMPWNQYYAGRLYRDGEDITGVDLLASSENKTWITNVSAASTKFRQENISPI